MYSAVVCSVSHPGMRHSMDGNRGAVAGGNGCIDGCFDNRWDGGKVGDVFHVYMCADARRGGQQAFRSRSTYTQLSLPREERNRVLYHVYLRVNSTTGKKIKS
ncbi:unnamed protein product, partial [Ectocarpus sp. 8 AP-2014]